MLSAKPTDPSKQCVPSSIPVHTLLSHSPLPRFLHLFPRLFASFLLSLLQLYVLDSHLPRKEEQKSDVRENSGEGSQHPPPPKTCVRCLQKKLDSILNSNYSARPKAVLRSCGFSNTDVLDLLAPKSELLGLWNDLSLSAWLAESPQDVFSCRSCGFRAVQDPLTAEGREELRVFLQSQWSELREEDTEHALAAFPAELGETALRHAVWNRSSCPQCRVTECRRCSVEPYHIGFDCEAWDQHLNITRCVTCRKPAPVFGRRTVERQLRNLRGFQKQEFEVAPAQEPLPVEARFGYQVKSPHATRHWISPTELQLDPHELSWEGLLWNPAETVQGSGWRARKQSRLLEFGRWVSEDKVATGIALQVRKGRVWLHWSELRETEAQPTAVRPAPAAPRKTGRRASFTSALRRIFRSPTSAQTENGEEIHEDAGKPEVEKESATRSFALPRSAHPIRLRLTTVPNSRAPAAGEEAEKEEEAEKAKGNTVRVDGFARVSRDCSLTLEILHPFVDMELLKSLKSLEDTDLLGLLQPGALPWLEFLPSASKRQITPMNSAVVMDPIPEGESFE